MLAVGESAQFFCSDDDPAKSPATNGANIVTVKAVIETGSHGKHLSAESVDQDCKFSSTQPDLMVSSDNNACQSTDEDDDNRISFNGDIVCSAHGELQMKFSRFC